MESGISIPHDNSYIINQIRSLPQTTQKLNNIESQKFTEIFDKVIGLSQKDENSTERLSFNDEMTMDGYLKKMGTCHMMRLNRMYCDGKALPFYRIYNFPLDPVESVKIAIEHHKEQLADNGVKSITIGREKLFAPQAYDSDDDLPEIKEQGEISVYLEVDTNAEIKTPYFAVDTQTDQAPEKQRFPDDLEGFLITDWKDGIEDIGEEPIQLS